MRKQILLTAIFIFAVPFCAQGQETALFAESHPLKIAIVGSAKYQDVSFVITNLKRSSQINKLVVSTSGRNLVRLSGDYNGSKESLIDEITNLSQDRFHVEVIKPKRYSPDTLSVTLKKLPPPTAP